MIAMQQTFLITGLTCLIASIVGGGLKAFGIEIPLLRSRLRQVILGLLGIFLVAAANFLSDPPNDGTIYEDRTPNTNNQKIKFIRLEARASHNPPTVNDRMWIEFTIQNDGDEPIRLLATYVTAYDPAEKQRDIGFLNKDRIIMPGEQIVTSGSTVLDAPGVWEFGPHYAIGTSWENAQYPGHWKRFKLPVTE